MDVSKSGLASWKRGFVWITQPRFALSTLWRLAASFVENLYLGVSDLSSTSIRTLLRARGVLVSHSAPPLKRTPIRYAAELRVSPFPWIWIGPYSDPEQAAWGGVFYSDDNFPEEDYGLDGFDIRLVKYVDGTRAEATLREWATFQWALLESDADLEQNLIDED
jgi:hypothetical protein